jgi:hypothetical protein
MSISRRAVKGGAANVHWMPAGVILLHEPRDRGAMAGRIQVVNHTVRKCPPEKQRQIRAIFEKQPLGELERLVTQTLLDAIKRVAKEELNGEKWLRSVARHSRQSYKQMRVTILEFLTQTTSTCRRRTAFPSSIR